LDSLDLSVDDAGPMTDAEFVAELDRRAAEMRSDPDAGIPWEQVQNMR
jgi:putative addiction module component (TIGR02574 family)